MQLERLKEWRESRGLTQKELAEKASVGEVTVARTEAGASIRPNTARKIAHALGREVSDLLQHPPAPAGLEEPARPKAQVPSSQLPETTEEEERRTVSDGEAPPTLTLEVVRRVLDEHIGTSWIARPDDEWKGWWRGIPQEEARARRQQIIKEWEFLKRQFVALQEGKPSQLPRRKGPGGVFLELWMRANIEAPESVPVSANEPGQAFKRRQWEDQPLEWTEAKHPQAGDAPGEASGAEAG
jgi:transcriptional regulator with XRE-family HTH domain